MASVQERREKDIACKDQSCLYREFFASSREALVIINADYEILEINKKATELLQIDQDHIKDSTFIDFIQTENKEILEGQLEMMEKEGNLVGEWTIGGSDGQSLHIRFSGIHSSQHYFFTLRDITSYKQKERNYEISTMQFKDIFLQVMDGFIVLDKESKIVDVNSFLLSKIGLKREEMAGNDFREYISEAYLHKWVEEWSVINQNGKINGEIEINVAGKKYFFEHNTYMNYYNSQVISVFKDMTEKRLIERELKQSKEIYAHLLEQAMDPIMLLNKQGIVLEVNEPACRTFASPKNGLIGKNLNDYVMKKGKRFYEVLRRFKEDKQVRDEFFFQMPDGKKKLLDFTSKIVDDDGLSVTIFRNISERYEMERKLRKSEKRFRKIFDEMPVGLILWKNEQIFDINEAAIKVIEHSKERLLNTTIMNLLGNIPSNSGALKQMLQKVKEHSSVEETLAFTFPESRIKHLEFSTKKNLVSGLNLTIINDVTERLEMQEQLRKSDTLSVVGELAAGIAHEIRNPMTALKGFIQLLQGSVSDEYSSYFSIINSELKRIDAIITEFLVLAKPQAIQYTEKDINAIMKETIDLLNAESLLHDVTIEAQFHPHSLPLYCEPNQLKQVFINIIKNAMEAMNHGGRIYISLHSNEDEQIKVVIKDEGSGIPTDKLKKLGEPFYTTKERGTGLGLMVSYKIIEEHSGKIVVESILNEGTTFTIYFPMRCYEENRGEA
ncbi:MAG: PAS domain S-box protein [Bacillus sp. (in: firmicutes)]